MDFIPDRLLRRGLRLRNALPEDPTPTGPNSAKITHALARLGQAGVVDDTNGQVLVPSSSATTIHSEKITHVAEKLTNAGLSNDDIVATSSSSHHGLPTKDIIIIAVVGAIVLLTLLVGGGLCWRRYRRRRAYNMVSKAVGNKGKSVMREKEDVFNADIQEAESFNVNSELHDSETMNPDQQRLTDRNFESGYDKVDTGYDVRRYSTAEEHGDKRARLEA